VLEQALDGDRRLTGRPLEARWRGN